MSCCTLLFTVKEFILKNVYTFNVNSIHISPLSKKYEELLLYCGYEDIILTKLDILTTNIYLFWKIFVKIIIVLENVTILLMIYKYHISYLI